MVPDIEEPHMMLAMSQEKLGDALDFTFQQVQKYENGTNRIGASRLEQISNILHVPVAFFFEGAPDASVARRPHGRAVSIAQIDDFVSDSNGLRLIGAFARCARGAAALCTSPSFRITTIVCPPPGRLPVSTRAHPNRKSVNARCATSLVASSSGLISPGELGRDQRTIQRFQARATRELRHKSPSHDSPHMRDVNLRFSRNIAKIFAEGVPS